MNIQQLKYFMEVARLKSYSKAAASLYISQQGISMAITRLESEFSTKLFLRTPKGLVLTPDGQYLLERAEVICGEFSKCLDYFNDHAARESVVNIAGVQGVISEFAADFMVSFQTQYPQYKLFLREYTDRECDQVVDKQEAELGLGLLPIDEDRFDCYPLFSKRLVLLVHRSHPLAGLSTVPTSALRDLPMALVDEKAKSGDYFLRQCTQLRSAPQVVHRVGEVIAVHRLVRQNKCAGLSVETVARDLNTPDVVALPFEDPNFRWTVALFKKKDWRLSPGARDFSAYLRKNVAEVC